MVNEVYANGREIACKAGAGKTICAMPDVCFTPPENPATPPGVPVPYPNTGFASDTTEGSKNVMISGKEIMLKNNSYFKTSTGDEAGCAAKKGVITSKNTGKVYFQAWSMDVKFEGENVDRHLDLTTNNHASMPGDTPTWPYLDSMSTSLDHPCVGDIKKEYEACKDYSPHNKNGPSPCPSDGKPTKETVDSYADKTAANKCLAARRCQLVPFEPNSQQASCCKGQTGHHLVEASSFYNVGRGGKKSKAVHQTQDYRTAKAPCICAEGTNQYQGTHGLLHTFQSTAAMTKITEGELKLEDGTIMQTKLTTYGEARDQGIAAVKKTFPESGCNEDCLKAQLDAYHNECGISDKKGCKQVITGYKGTEPLAEAEKAVLERSGRLAAGNVTSGPAF